MKNYLFLIALVFGQLAMVGQFNRDNSNDRNKDRNKNRNRRSPSLAIGIQVAQPLGDFAHFYDGVPAGVGFQLLLNSGRSPFEFGGGFAWQGMGSEKQDISIFQGEDFEGDEVWSHGNMQVNSNIYMYNGIARLRPFAGDYQVYGDLVAGLKTFSTKTTIEEDNGGYKEVIDQRRDHRDFAITYGWALGVKIRVSQFILIEGRFEKLRGGNASYIDPESISIDNEGILTYSQLESNTSINNYQLGLSFEF